MPNPNAVIEECALRLEEFAANLEFNPETLVKLAEMPDDSRHFLANAYRAHARLLRRVTP
jgi:hypothetical protein